MAEAGVVVLWCKLLPVMLVTNIRATVQGSAAPLQSHLPAVPETTQILGSLPPTWETWMEILAPGFNLARPVHCRHLGSEPVNTNLSVCNSIYPISRVKSVKIMPGFQKFFIKIIIF